MTTINPNLSKNEVFEILCRKISIPAIAPMLPPRKETPNRVASEILRRCKTDFLLSNPKTIKLNRLINTA